MTAEQLTERGEAFESVGSDKFGQAAHADVVGALVGGLLGLVVDLVEVGNSSASSAVASRAATIGRGQGRQALATQVFESMPKCRGVDLTVYPWRGDDELAGTGSSAAARPCRPRRRMGRSGRRYTSTAAGSSRTWT